jgi:hypothetical protein
VLAILGLVGLVAGESFAFELAVERLLAAREQRSQSIKTAGSPYEQAREALDLAIAERRAECADGLGKRCTILRGLEDQKRTAVAALPAPMSHTLVADATGLPPWLVEIVTALAFSTGLIALGFLLVGYGAHGEAVQTAVPDEREKVIGWVREYHRRHGRSPRIPEVQVAFGLKKSTAYLRIEQARR